MDAVEAQNQINQMVNFILNEAKDKAEEIESGAIEEFNIEKMTIFEQKKEEVRAKIERNINMLRLEKIRARNKELKEMSSAILQYQCEVVDEIKRLALEKLNTLAQNHQEYKKVLTMLALSGCVSLECDVVLVRCRPSDADAVEATLDDVRAEYEKLTQLRHGQARPLSLDLDRAHPLHEDLIGVVLTNEDGTIECNVTLNNRLERCCTHIIPEIKAELFSAVATK